VRYAYYANLKPRDKATYRRSDETLRLPLTNRAAFAPLVSALRNALESEERARVERASRALADAISIAFGVSPVRVKVLSRRPSTRESELHGLYEPGDPRTAPVLRVWMRTSQHKRVVAFRTFLRTLLHELCHHLDYELLKLDDSFHTEGFFKRESSLFKQLVPAG
jgi:hypothetical protein